MLNEIERKEWEAIQLIIKWKCWFCRWHYEPMLAHSVGYTATPHKRCAAKVLTTSWVSAASELLLQEEGCLHKCVVQRASANIHWQTSKGIQASCSSSIGRPRPLSHFSQLHLTGTKHSSHHFHSLFALCRYQQRRIYKYTDIEITLGSIENKFIWHLLVFLLYLD